MVERDGGAVDGAVARSAGVDVLVEPSEASSVPVPVPVPVQAATTTPVDRARNVRRDGSPPSRAWHRPSTRHLARRVRWASWPNCTHELYGDPPTGLGCWPSTASPVARPAVRATRQRTVGPSVGARPSTFAVTASRSTSAPWHFEQHVTDLLDTLDAAGWTEPVDVVGHSMGGAIATFLLAVAPGSGPSSRAARPVVAPRRRSDLRDRTSKQLAGNDYASLAEVEAERRSNLDPSGSLGGRGRARPSTCSRTTAAGSTSDSAPRRSSPAGARWRGSRRRCRSAGRPSW